MIPTKIFIRDVRRLFQGQVTDFKQCDAILRVNDLGSWSIELPPGDEADLLRDRGAGIQLERFNKPILSGPVTQISRSKSTDSDNYTISGVTDDVILWDTLVWPGQPTYMGNSTWRWQQKVSDTFTAPAESVMYYFVNGQVCDPTRIIPGVPQIVTSDDLSRGVTVTGKGRFNAVAEVLQDVAQKNTALGGTPLIFAIADSTFSVREATDRRADSVFSFESGNLLGYDLTTKTPTATHVIEGGAGEDMGQVMVRYGSDLHARRFGRRIEIFQNARDVTQDADASADIDQQSVSAMIEAAFREINTRIDLNEISLRPIDVPYRTFGVDYDLGDLVTAEDIDGVLSEVHLTLDENGETITPAVGASTTTAALNILQQRDAMRKLAKRVSIIERTYT